MHANGCYILKNWAKARGCLVFWMLFEPILRLVNHCLLQTVARRWKLFFFIFSFLKNEVQTRVHEDQIMDNLQDFLFGLEDEALAFH